VFSHKVFLFLSEVTEVSGRASSEDLASRDGDVSFNDSSSRDDSKAFDSCTSVYSCSHTDEAEVLNSTGIKAGVRADLNVVSNGNLIACGGVVASDVNVVLDDGVLADVNSGLVSTDDNSVPERSSFSKIDITDDSGIRRDPVGS